MWQLWHHLCGLRSGVHCWFQISEVFHSNISSEAGARWLRKVQEVAERMDASIRWPPLWFPAAWQELLAWQFQKEQRRRHSWLRQWESRLKNQGQRYTPSPQNWSLRKLHQNQSFKSVRKSVCTPSSAHSTARDRVKFSTPALAAPGRKGRCFQLMLSLQITFYSPLSNEGNLCLSAEDF